ncbi:MAG: hypothetical protein ABIH11_02045 [Candidatus Altiarchaeota archaeon]
MEYEIITFQANRERYQRTLTIIKSSVRAKINLDIILFSTMIAFAVGFTTQALIGVTADTLLQAIGGILILLLLLLVFVKSIRRVIILQELHVKLTFAELFPEKWDLKVPIFESETDVELEQVEVVMNKENTGSTQIDE